MQPKVILKADLGKESGRAGEGEGAFLLYDRDGNRISEKCYIIKPEGYKIPADAARIHGITTDRAICEGKDLRSVLEEFREFARLPIALNLIRKGKRLFEDHDFAGGFKLTYSKPLLPE